VVPHDELLLTARQWAGRLADGPSLALSMTKRMINNEQNMDLATALEAEAQAQALMLMADDHRRFYEAFKKKEKPQFGGR
jgi:enoyl-CoA hydratase/carnithine racemase